MGTQEGTGGYVVRREGVEDGKEWRMEEGEGSGGASEVKDGMNGRKGR
jgi:hypothetical protein